MKQRDVYLESIRGVASLVVVIHHLILAFVPELKSPVAEMQGEPWWFRLMGASPLGVLTNGEFAVRLFFVLSGFVLSIAYFKKKQLAVIGAMAVRRYPRLMIPVFASILAAWIIQELNGYHNRAAAELMQQGPSWLQLAQPHSFTFLQALEQGLYGTFFFFNRDYTLNAVLWSMSVELAGSVFVFVFLALFGMRSWRAAAYAVAALVLGRFDPYLFDFLLGMILCDLRVNRFAGRDFPVAAAIAILLLGLFIGGIDGDVYQFYLHHKAHLASLWPSFGAALIVGAAAFSPHTQTALQHPVLSFLGRISFQLYLYHQMIIFSLGCGLYLWLRHAAISDPVSAWISSFVVLAVSLTWAWITYRAVDKPAVEFGHRLATYLRVSPPRKAR